MKRARAFGFWGLSIFTAASFVYACSSSSSGVTGGGGSGKDATTNDDGSSSNDDGSTTNNDSGSSNKDGSTDDAGSGPCSSTGTYNDCVSCCDGYSDGGVTQFYTLQFECLCNSKKCGTASKCKNTFCADPSVTDAGVNCNNCIDQKLADDAGDAGCQDPVINECAADMGCAMGIECVIDSNCGAKP